MIKKIKFLLTKEKASGMLELVMFLPVALLILFLGTDASLRFVEKSSISSKLKKELRRSDILVLNNRLDGQKNLDLNQTSQNLDNLSESIESKLLNIKNSMIAKSSQEYLIESHLVKVNFNIQTGDIIANNLDLIKSSRIGSISSDKSDIKTEIENLLNKDSSSHNISKLESGNFTLKYSEEKYYVFVKLKTKSKGIIPESWSSNLAYINESYILNAVEQSKQLQ